jgi:hypothetical protein
MLGGIFRLQKIRVLREALHQTDKLIQDLIEEENQAAIAALAFYRDNMEIHIIALEEFKRLPCISSEKVRLQDLINVVENTILCFIYEYFNNHTETDFKQQYGLYFTEALKHWCTFLRKYKL